jgi:hypothetical protein
MPSQMIDLPSPFAPMKDLLASLRALESSQRSDVVTQGGIQMLREAIAHRKANPQPGDPR